VMLRTLGIPSRVATGFSATTLNPITGYYEVAQLDGHAWVEAWIDGTGWVTFEPTAFYELPKPRPVETKLRQLSRYAEQLESREKALEEAGAEPAKLTPGEVMRSLWLAFVKGLDAIGTLVANLYYRFRGSLLLLALLLGAAWIFWLLARVPVQAALCRWRLQRYLRGSSEASIERAYLEMEKLLALRGQGRAAHESIQEYGRRLAAVGPAYRELPPVFDAVSEVQYSGRPCAAPGCRELLQALKRAIQSILDGGRGSGPEEE